MSSLAMGGVIVLVTMILFATGMPIAFALALTAMVSILLFLGPSEFDLFGKFLFDSLNDFGLLAIPLFVLMGNLFGGSVASRHLFEAGEVWLRRVHGGLAMSSVVASSVFAALTGASAATAAAIGKVAVPEMRTRGYSARISTGAVAAGGTLGILIPPSVTLILYGIASEQSIGQLFAGGIITGIIITLSFCLWIYVASLRESRSVTQTSTRAEPGEATNPRVAPQYAWKKRWISLAKVLPFVALVLGVLTVLYAGIATPSEAAAVGVLLVMLLVGVAYRGLKVREFIHVLLETTNQSTMILMITAFSAVIATILSFLHIPQDLALTVTELEVNKWLVMVAINVVLLLMGLFLPPVSIVVMLTPVLLPLIVGLGFDPIWFGIIMTINLEMGLITPPVGLNLYVIKGIAPDVPVSEILRGALPYIVILAATLLVFSIFPGLITWLPGVLY